MKRLALMVVLSLSLVFNLMAGDIYQKGTIKLIPDDTFAQGCDWSRLFTSNLPTLPKPQMVIRETMTLAPDNTIYVVEYNNLTAGNLFIFDSGGRLQSTKPDTSEKVNPSVWAKHPGLAAVNDKNELWIGEYSGLARCDRQGHVLAISKLDHPITDFIFLKGGALVVSGYVVTSQEANPIRLVVSLLNPQTNKEDVIARFNEKAFDITLKLEGKGGLVGMGMSRSGVGMTVIAGTPEGNLVIGYSDSPEILLYSQEGRRISGFILPIQRPTINSEQKAEAMQRISQGLDYLASSKKVSADEIKRAREKLKEYPTTLPYYSNLLIDEQGNILIFLTNRDNSANVEYMAFSQSGKALGTGCFILPKGVSLRLNGHKQMMIRNGWLYALIHKNVLGKEQVQLARFKLE